MAAWIPNRGRLPPPLDLPPPRAAPCRARLTSAVPKTVVCVKVCLHVQIYAHTRLALTHKHTSPHKHTSMRACMHKLQRIRLHMVYHLTRPSRKGKQNQKSDRSQKKRKHTKRHLIRQPLPRRHCDKCGVDAVLINCCSDTVSRGWDLIAPLQRCVCFTTLKSTEVKKGVFARKEDTFREKSDRKEDERRNYPRVKRQRCGRVLSQRIFHVSSPALEMKLIIRSFVKTK